MNKRHLISIAAVGALAASSAWLGAQTEVPAPTEELAPAPAPAADSVDSKTKSAADDALKNFKSPTPEAAPAPAPAPAPVAESTTVTTETTTTTTTAAPAPAMEADPIIPAPPTATEVDAAKAKAKELGVSDEALEKAEGALSKAANEVKDADPSDVDAAMKALEALGQQAKKALEEADVVGDGTGGTARSVATEPGEDNSLMPDSLNLDSLPPDAASRASQVVEELGSDAAALAKVDAKRQEFVSKIMAESDSKKQKLTFRKAFTAATNSPDAVALKASAEQAATDPEKRDLLRQYYAVVFADVNKRAPGIKAYTAEREKEYQKEIDAQLPPTEAISLAPVEPVVTPIDQPVKPGTDT